MSTEDRQIFIQSFEADDEGKIIAGPNWNLDDVIQYIIKTGFADVEEDNFGNIVVYPSLHEDQDGNLVTGNNLDVPTYPVDK